MRTWCPIRLGGDEMRGEAGPERIVAGDKGSLTVEAALILPLILLLTVVFLQWGLMMRQDLRDAGVGDKANRGATGALIEENEGQKGTAFLYGGLPARRIRDVDFMIGVGKSLKELLPQWISSGED